MKPPVPPRLAWEINKNFSDSTKSLYFSVLPLSTTIALNGGEDYELLFTVPIGDHEKIEAMEGVRQIGYITKENLGKFLITRDGQEFELKAQGWNPLKD